MCEDSLEIGTSVSFKGKRLLMKALLFQIQEASVDHKAPEVALPITLAHESLIISSLYNRERHGIRVCSQAALGSSPNTTIYPPTHLGQVP